MSDTKRAKAPPPPDDDPRFMRTCTRCHHVRNWRTPLCPRCRNPEFMLPKDAANELQWLFDQAANPHARSVDEIPSREGGH